MLIVSLVPRPFGVFTLGLVLVARSARVREWREGRDWAGLAHDR